MTMGDEQMDLIVGIDFGMTCTANSTPIGHGLGVSYTNLSIGSTAVKCIQNWPGRAHANENKVPTIVVYPRMMTITPQTRPSSWGFLSETAAELNKDYKDWFKTYLDPVRLAGQQQATDSNAPSSMVEVEKWYEDYLGLLYKHIEFKLNPELSTSWHNAKIEFIFSVPTTWNPPTVERFRSIAERAGFATARSHNLSIGLTEAEAAAVHTSVEAAGIFKEREVLLVCDAGGGTTDLSVLRVTNTRGESLSLEQLDVVFGANIGSATIDYEFQQLVMKRLAQTDISDREDIAWGMMKSSDFQNTKCAHGGPDDTPLFSIRIPQINPGYVNQDVRIRNGDMEFTRWELKSIFDKQIEQLIRLIDNQLTNMRQKFPYEQVAHLVLSGGLGHSPYVQERLRSYYTLDASHSNAGGMQVRTAPDPQLAVCKGLVADRVSRIRSGVSILNWRCCRASYGTLCREVYNPENPYHNGREITKDPMNGKQFVTQSVEWFIKKGEAVAADATIIRNFKRTFAPGNSQRVFPTSVVVSHIDSKILPPYMSADAQILCDIESDLSSADESNFKEKNKRFWKRGKHYFQIEYQIQVLIGPADIRFELWFDGIKLNKDQPITVEWQAAPAPEPTRPTGGDEGILAPHHPSTDYENMDG